MYVTRALSASYGCLNLHLILGAFSELSDLYYCQYSDSMEDYCVLDRPMFHVDSMELSILSLSRLKLSREKYLLIELMNFDGAVASLVVSWVVMQH